MKFIDEVKITVRSGRGGDGCIGFRREKHVPRGGPDGGNGGNGGSVIFEADENINTLLHFRGKKVFAADNGQAGSGMQCDGHYGADLILKVPVGTLVREQDTDYILCDLAEHGQQSIVAQGGIGGFGNAHFKNSVNQTPRFAQKGFEGEELAISLELKLLADIALVGLPNAGKSTLISCISAARPKIADYPFTTLEPNLGVVEIDEVTHIVVADIPGLIEHASEGRGLGTKFLKHIERTSALVHLVDISECTEPFEAFEAYTTIRAELEKYGRDLSTKKEIVCLTKIDSMLYEDLEEFVDLFEKQLDKKVLPISAVSGKNLDVLKRIMLKTKETATK